ncbi:TIGR02680 family protein [Peribacillus simplex]|nr:TIGR02680 family protein [Peribacillus simplex]
MEQTKRVDSWFMYRAIFFNYWYYPNQELIFKNGCAVLRGHNASGKSVTTQSLITVLLDGDVRSHKLDPFGGRERKITDTVLGEKELLGLNQRIGYIALEFKKGNSGVTKTIGMGIEANREKKQPKVWYFVINGKRIGENDRDLNLYKEESFEGEKRNIPLDEKKLRIQIEQKLQCGKVFSNRDDYASAVNKQLFGFETLESYKGLIDLLLQARSPRLSDQNKPEGAVAVLNDSLPQLTEEEIRPLTSSIESIDRLEKDLLTYKRDLKAIQSLHTIYTEYNEVALAEKADAYIKSLKHYEMTKKKVSDSKIMLTKYKHDLENVQMDFRRVNDELEISKREKADLGVEEIESLQDRKDQEEKNIEAFAAKIDTLTAKKEDALRLYRQYREQYETYEQSRQKKEKELSSYLGEIRDLANVMGFEKHTRFFDHFKGNINQERYSFGSWEMAIKEYKTNVEKTKSILERHEQLNNQMMDYQNALGRLRMKIDHAQLAIDKIEKEYDLEVMNLRDAIIAWANQSILLDIPTHLTDALLISVEEVFDSVDKEQFLRTLNKHVDGKKAEIRESIVRLQWEIEQKEKEILIVDTQLKEWKNKKEVEPLFVAAKKEDWKLLQEQGIDYIPFYEAFEFKEQVQENEKVAIQNALFESGILSSVVVAKEMVKESSAYSSVLAYKEPKAENLGDVLVAAESDAFNEVLKGIAFEKNTEGYISIDGTYETNFVLGKSSLFDANVFIGKASREAYRNKKIEILETERYTLLLDKERIGDRKAVQLHLENEVFLEYDNFPNIDPLKGMIGEMKTEQEKIDNIYEPEIVEKSGAMAKLADSMKDIMTEIKQGFGYESNLPLQLDAILAELEKIADYVDCLQDIKDSYKDVHASHIHERNLLMQVEMQEEYEEGYRSDIVDMELAMEKSRKIVKGLIKRLNDLDSNDILKRVEELSRKINEELPLLRDDLIRKETDLTSNITEEERKIIRIEESDIPFEKEISESWEKTLAEQINMHLITIDDKCRTLQEKATFISERYGHLVDKNRVTLDRIKKRLNKKYQDQIVELPDYELEMVVKGSEYAPHFDTEDENKIIALNYVQDQMTRIVITMYVDNHRVPTMNAVDGLTKKIDQLEFDANEKDRQLYQEILINTLGDSIRRKIQYVERWEKEMNKFMEHKNIIKFRIKWVAKKTDKEGEIDTKKLVEALKQDSRWIDIDKISAHFRSKIKEAKRQFDKEGETNLQQIMRDVLDYRKWFDFEIYFTKKNGKERRLNKNSYGELSGGQRVLAMVTPVLAALYAKYLEGREDAPRIFTLDEAFARVDDENVNVMFDYIYKLGFNYILNSQSLWGCFESVPSLNIYELSRPDNRPFVAIQSYYWNGNNVKRVDEEWVKELEAEEEKAYAE